MITDSGLGGSMECLNQGGIWLIFYIFEDNMSLNINEASYKPVIGSYYMAGFSEKNAKSCMYAKEKDAFPLLLVQHGQAGKDLGGHHMTKSPNSSEVYRQLSSNSYKILKISRAIAQLLCMKCAPLASAEPTNSANG